MQNRVLLEMLAILNMQKKIIFIYKLITLTKVSNFDNIHIKKN